MRTTLAKRLPAARAAPGRQAVIEATAPTASVAEHEDAPDGDGLLVRGFCIVSRPNHDCGQVSCVTLTRCYSGRLLGHAPRSKHSTFWHYLMIHSLGLPSPSSVAWPPSDIVTAAPPGSTWHDEVDKEEQELAEVA